MVRQRCGDRRRVSTMADEEALVPLADAIRGLRGEIVRAMREGQDADVRFRVGPIELEFALEVGRKKDVKGGIAFWVVTLGGGGERTSATTHRVKLVVTPLGPDGDVLVTDPENERPE
jgi:hypothetical protein